MYVIRRLLLVLLGILIGALAAGALLVISQRWGLEIPDTVTQDEANASFWVNTLIYAGFALYYGFVPGLAVGIATEALRARQALIFLLAGAAIGLLGAYLDRPSWASINAESGEPLTAMPWRTYPAMGIAAGFLYWLVAGIRAGFRRDPA